MYDITAETKMLFKSYIKKVWPPFSSSSSSSNVNVNDKDLKLPLLSSNHEDYYCCPVSESFTDMVMQCRTWDPEKRPSVDRLLSHPFFTNSLYPEKDGQYFYDALMKKTSSSSY